jgi:FtsZ-interacting cell division protein ZipA
MAELRWALIGLGALFVVVLAIWEWRRGRRRQAQGAAVAMGGASAASADDWRRKEPRIDDPGFDDLPQGRTGTHAMEWDTADAPLQEVPVIHPADPVPSAHFEPAQPVDVAVSHEVAVDVPAAAQPAAPAAAAAASAPAAALEIRWPPERADRVLALRVASAQGALLTGRQVRLALEQAGMVHGPQCIYHRVDEDGAVIASAANMLRPGDLDPRTMDETQLRGLSLFSVLPGPLPPVRMLEELVSLARAVAWRLGAVVQDDHGVELDGERLVKLRQSLPEAPGQEAS